MENNIYLQPNEWITCKKLCEVTGFTPGKVRSYRQKGWRQGKEWILVSCDGIPKSTSEALYHLPSINKWFSNQTKSQPDR